VVAALKSAPISGTLSQKRGDESIAPRFSQQRSVDWTYRQKIRIMGYFAIIHAATSYTTPDGQQAHG
jgi:hypothetical protein